MICKSPTHKLKEPDLRGYILVKVYQSVRLVSLFVYVVVLIGYWAKVGLMLALWTQIGPSSGIG